MSLVKAAASYQDELVVVSIHFNPKFPYDHDKLNKCTLLLAKSTHNFYYITWYRCATSIEYQPKSDIDHYTVVLN